MGNPMYPDNIQGWEICHMEGCLGKGHCPRCGKVSYSLMGWYGAVARNAKRWRVSEQEAEKRIEQHRLLANRWE